MSLSLRAWVKSRSAHGSLYSMHPLSKATLFGTLCGVVFLYDIRKIILFVAVILALLLFSYRDMMRHPWRWPTFALTCLGCVLYVTLADPSATTVDAVAFALKFGGILLLAFAAEGIFSDREIVGVVGVFLGRRVGLIVVGFLAGLQHVPSIIGDVRCAQHVHGLGIRRDPKQQLVFFMTRMSAVLLALADFAVYVDNQFRIRKYASISRNRLLGNSFGAGDCIALLLVLTLIICAIVPWGYTGGRP